MNKQHEESMETTTESFIQEMLSDAKNGDAFAVAFLKSSILSSAADALFQARRDAQLTQKDVAKALGTRQPAIARLEANTSGSITLHRYFDFAAACGMVPLLMLAPEHEVLSYAKAHPGDVISADTFMRWKVRNEIPQWESSFFGLVSQPDAFNTSRASQHLQRRWSKYYFQDNAPTVAPREPPLPEVVGQSSTYTTESRRGTLQPNTGYLHQEGTLEQSTGRPLVATTA